MRLIDADELIEHAWRDKLDSRELIAGMIEKAPTVKEIPTKIPVGVYEELISQKVILDKVKTEIEKQDKWLAQAGYNAYNVDIAFNSIKRVIAESGDKTMTREEAINQLNKLKSFHNGSYGEAINFAIESIKVDMAYDLAYEEVESEDEE